MGTTSNVTAARVTTSDGIELQTYVHDGPFDEAPTIVLVHGYPDDHTVWDGVVAELAPYARVVTYDVRGAGDSDVPGTGVAAYALEQLSRDLVAVLDHVSPDAPVHLAAHDWGSIQAWEPITDPTLRDRFVSYTSISGPSLDHAGRWLRDPSHPRASAGQLLHSYYVGLFQLPVVPEFLSGIGVIDTLVNLSARRGQALRLDVSRRPRQNVVNGINLYRANFLPALLSPEPRSTTVPVQVIAPLDDPHVTVALQTEAPRPFVTDLHTRTVVGNHWVVAQCPAMIAGKILEFVGYADGLPLPSALHHPTGGGAFADQRVLVLGAGTGVGRAVAVAYAAEGARVALADDDAAAARDTAGLVGANGVVLPAPNEADFAGRTAREWGIPTIVINACGRQLAQDFAELLSAYAEGGTIINLVQPPHSTIARATARMKREFKRDGVRVAAIPTEGEVPDAAASSIIELVAQLS